jgi:hypothetical protein
MGHGCALFKQDKMEKTEKVKYMGDLEDTLEYT